MSPADRSNYCVFYASMMPANAQWMYWFTTYNTFLKYHSCHYGIISWKTFKWSSHPKSESEDTSPKSESFLIPDSEGISCKVRKVRIRKLSDFGDVIHSCNMLPTCPSDSEYSKTLKHLTIVACPLDKFSFYWLYCLSIGSR